jgi:hypothetical protein
LRADAETGWSGWNISHFDTNFLAPLIGDLMVRAHYQRRTFDWDLDADSASPRQQRAGGGLLYAGTRFNLAADASLTRWSDGHETQSASASMALNRLLAGTGLGASGSWWRDEDADSYYLAPWLERSFGRVRTNLSWQQYHASGAAASDYQSAVFSVSFPMAGGLYTMIRASTQWGAGSSQRLFMTLSKSF